MNHPRELILQDVRCFQGEQRGSLRPITLLVGENSTGKTTFLGCYSVLHRVFSRWRAVEHLDFNEEPFLMGSFRDIVRTRRGRSGRINKFKLGFTIAHPRGKNGRSYPLLVTFSEKGSQPVVSSFRWQFDAESFLELRRGESGQTILIIPNRAATIDLPFDSFPMLSVLTDPEAQRWFLTRIPDGQPVIDYLQRLFPDRKARRRATLPDMPPLIPVAPLRSKPKRTYDPVRETATPDGEHIPMMMMRLDRTDKEHWSSLRDNLVAFGRRSGLFSDIRIKRHGRQMSDPFQLRVKVRSGSYSNIVDAGYGISQSLPILVDVLAEEPSFSGGRGRIHRRGRSFLLQQPEVHLHPRGQAELASLFIESYTKRGDWFLIETHSDYIVDRVRIAVRKQMLKADDVSILYFEPHGDAVGIHSMTLDDHGNLQDAPNGYRDFFVRETDRLLGFAD